MTAALPLTAKAVISLRNNMVAYSRMPILQLSHQIKRPSWSTRRYPGIFPSIPASRMISASLLNKGIWSSRGMGGPEEHLVVLHELLRVRHNLNHFWLHYMQNMIIFIFYFLNITTANNRYIRFNQTNLFHLLIVQMFLPTLYYLFLKKANSFVYHQG